MSHRFTVKLSQQFTVTLFHLLHYHTVILSHCLTVTDVTLQDSHTVTLSHCRTVTPSHFHTCDSLYTTWWRCLAPACLPHLWRIELRLSSALPLFLRHYRHSTPDGVNVLSHILSLGHLVIRHNIHAIKRNNKKTC